MQQQRQPQTRWQHLLAFAFVATAAGSAALLAIGLLAGCETQALYEACPLDEEVTKKGVCNGSTAEGHDTSSCVVTAHPQCDQSICLSYFGQPAFCTMTCTADSDCGAGAFCWTYADAETSSDATKAKPAQRYCVPDREKTLATAK
jgi:hypothetical protein